MAKHWSIAPLVVLALLGCLAGTEVEASLPQIYKKPPFSPPPHPPPPPPPPPPPHPPHPPPPGNTGGIWIPPNPWVSQVHPPPWKKPPHTQDPWWYQKPVPPHGHFVGLFDAAQGSTDPQNPQNPQKPQIPQTPPKPQIPQTPPKPQIPQTPPKPQIPQTPPKPQIPQTPPKSQIPQTPPKTQYPQPPGTAGDQFAQKPQIHHQPPKMPPGYVATPQSHPLPAAENCDVDQSVRVSCGTSGISATECEALNCCYDGQQCYFGNAVTVHCTQDGHFIVVAAKHFTVPHIDTQTIALQGQGEDCVCVDSNSAFAIFQFPVTACGTTVMEEPGIIVYENRMITSYEVAIGPRGTITRDSTFDLLFQCRYTTTTVKALVVQVSKSDTHLNPVAAWGSLSVQMRLGNGKCTVKGCNEVDVAYTSYYMAAEYPVTIALRQPVYVEVGLFGNSDPQLILTLGHCWANTSPNPHTLPRWDLLIDGCPNVDDRYMSSLLHAPPNLMFPNHYKHFFFKMFAFVDPGSMEPLKQHVYIHCSTALCVEALGYNCEPVCHGTTKTKRDVKAVEQKTDGPKVVVSSGPLIITAPEQ